MRPLASGWVESPHEKTNLADQQLDQLVSCCVKLTGHSNETKAEQLQGTST